MPPFEQIISIKVVKTDKPEPQPKFPARRIDGRNCYPYFVVDQEICHYCGGNRRLLSIYAICWTCAYKFHREERTDEDGQTK